MAAPSAAGSGNFTATASGLTDASQVTATVGSGGGAGNRTGLGLGLRMGL